MTERKSEIVERQTNAKKKMFGEREAKSSTKYNIIMQKKTNNHKNKQKHKNQIIKPI